MPKPFQMSESEAKRVYRKMQRQRYVLGQLNAWANGPDPIDENHTPEFLAGYAAARRHLRERMWAALQTARTDPKVVTRNLHPDTATALTPGGEADA